MRLVLWVEGLHRDEGKGDGDYVIRRGEGAQAGEEDVEVFGVGGRRRHDWWCVCRIVVGL